MEKFLCKETDIVKVMLFIMKQKLNYQCFMCSVTENKHKIFVTPTTCGTKVEIQKYLFHSMRGLVKAFNELVGVDNKHNYLWFDLNMIEQLILKSDNNFVDTSIIYNFIKEEKRPVVNFFAMFFGSLKFFRSMFKGCWRHYGFLVWRISNIPLNNCFDTTEVTDE